MLQREWDTVQGVHPECAVQCAVQCWFWGAQQCAVHCEMWCVQCMVVGAVQCAVCSAPRAATAAHRGAPVAKTVIEATAAGEGIRRAQVRGGGGWSGW